MNKNRKLIQLALLVAVGLLVFFIYSSQKNDSIVLKSENKSQFTDSPEQSNWDYNVNTIVQELLNSDSFSNDLKVAYTQLKEDTTDQLLLSLATGWDSVGHRLVAGYFYEKLALRTNTEEYWQKAGNSFFEIQDRVNDSSIQATLTSHSILAFNKVIELNPNNLDAKADLAVCLLESQTAPPMQAIGLLREVIQLDSLNVKGLFYLGFFSMQSTQYAKAAERFKKLTQIEPNNALYYQYLGQALALSGEKEQALVAFEKHLSLLTNESARKEVQIIIENLKNEIKN